MGKTKGGCICDCLVGGVWIQHAWGVNGLSPIQYTTHWFSAAARLFFCLGSWMWEFCAKWRQQHPVPIKFLVIKIALDWIPVVSSWCLQEIEHNFYLLGEDSWRVHGSKVGKSTVVGGFTAGPTPWRQWDYTIVFLCALKWFIFTTWLHSLLSMCSLERCLLVLSFW